MSGNPFDILKTLDRDQLKQNELKEYENHPKYEIIKKAKNKGKLNTKEQIEYLKFKGIEFNHMSESEAEDYLSKNSYYYKLTVYRKNFTKNNEQKYQYIDFATLRDLAIIDMHLRYLLIQLALDVEHSIKTRIINLITMSDEDGYSIIDEYDQYQLDNLVSKSKLTTEDKEAIKRNYVPVVEKIMHDLNSPRSYHEDLYNKHHQHPSIWVLIELMSYGALASFIRFYVRKEKFGYKQLKDANDFMHYSKNIRDSAAHSRPIIFNLIGPEQIRIEKPKLKIRNYLISLGVSKDLLDKHLKNVKVHDIISLLYLHYKYIKVGKTRKVRMREMLTFLKRVRRDNHLYCGTEKQEFSEILSIFIIILKNFVS